MRQKAALILFALTSTGFLLNTAWSFDVTTVAKVEYVDEWDVGYTKIQLDRPTSCGANGIWMLRTMEGYDLYMARVLAAMMAGRSIRITERAPAYCDGSYLYNARIGSM